MAGVVDMAGLWRVSNICRSRACDKNIKTKHISYIISYITYWQNKTVSMADKWIYRCSKQWSSTDGQWSTGGLGWRCLNRWSNPKGIRPKPPLSPLSMITNVWWFRYQFIQPAMFDKSPERHFRPRCTKKCWCLSSTDPEWPSTAVVTMGGANLISN